MMDASRDAEIALCWRVLGVVVEVTGIAAHAILGRPRTGHIVWARQMLMAALVERGMTGTGVGLFLGRDHSTVMHGVQRVRAARRAHSDGDLWKVAMLLDVDGALADVPPLPPPLPKASPAAPETVAVVPVPPEPRRAPTLGEALMARREQCMSAAYREHLRGRYADRMAQGAYAAGQSRQEIAEAAYWRRQRRRGEWREVGVWA